jgi:hypothetical protein
VSSSSIASSSFLLKSAEVAMCRRIYALQLRLFALSNLRDSLYWWNQVAGSCKREIVWQNAEFKGSVVYVCVLSFELLWFIRITSVMYNIGYIGLFFSSGIFSLNHNLVVFFFLNWRMEVRC